MRQPSVMAQQLMEACLYESLGGTLELLSLILFGWTPRSVSVIRFPRVSCHFSKPLCACFPWSRATIHVCNCKLCLGLRQKPRSVKGLGINTPKKICATPTPKGSYDYQMTFTSCILSGVGFTKLSSMTNYCMLRPPYLNAFLGFCPAVAAVVVLPGTGRAFAGEDCEVGFTIYSLLQTKETPLYMFSRISAV